MSGSACRRLWLQPDLAARSGCDPDCVHILAAKIAISAHKISSWRPSTQFTTGLFARVVGEHETAMLQF